MIDWEGVNTSSNEALRGVSERWGTRVKLAAKRRAPVRKVFEGQSSSERIRLKSIDEIESDRGLRKRLGLGPEYGPLNAKRVNPATILTQFAPQELGQRAIASPGRLKLRSAQDRLDRRGRWELKSMRAAHRGKLGGRLRDEIFTGEVRISGNTVRIDVVSPTEYAKFQELGTRHHPAHPYMRPSAYESVEEVRADLRRTMPPVVRPHLHATIPVVIRI